MIKTSIVLNSLFSANNMYVPLARGVMSKSKKYNDWISKNLPLVDLSSPSRYPVKVEILLMVNYNWTKKNDPDNYIKPVMDLLVRAGVFPDDTNKYISGVEVRTLYLIGEPVMRISYELV